MIVVKNAFPPIEAFQDLMAHTDDLLNQDAAKREDYYMRRNGIALEKDVFDALRRCAAGTAFDDLIELVSGASFPDIVAARYYGVEVKSTKANRWVSTGSSVLESTRVEDVEHIFLTFGKLGRPVRFWSKPYQECMSDISVTHHPRYKIDMRLGSGETIFDKMGIAYDELRKMSEPEKYIAQYYKKHLRPGQRLWWAGSETEGRSASPVLSLWSTLTSEQKNFYTVRGYALFPEILGSRSKKYERFALWLVTDCSILNTNLRDQFSAGGRVDVETTNGVFHNMPAVFGRIAKNKELIKETILASDIDMLLDCWNLARIQGDRLDVWCNLVANHAGTYNDISSKNVLSMLYGLFF